MRQKKLIFVLGVTEPWLARAHFTAASFRRRRETMDKTSIRAGPQNGPRRSPASISSNMKARQSAKLRELRQALVNAGFSALDKQAKVLQLSRSTAWTVMSGSHKSSGLSATIIKRMLTSQQLPPPARTVVLEYVGEKMRECTDTTNTGFAYFVLS